MDETILVIRREALLGTGTFTGIQSDWRPFLNQLERHAFLASRQEAERRTDWKQPITYILITQDHEVFTTIRSQEGIEERLHNRVSIGIGGHLRPHAAMEEDFRATLADNSYRELTEELRFAPPLGFSQMTRQLEPIGVLNDDRDEVGQCHFGLVLRLQLEPGVSVTVRETDLLRGAFKNLSEMPPIDRMESWSRFCLRLLEQEWNRAQ